MAALLHLAHRVGTEFMVENPDDRGDESEPEHFIHLDHGPLWEYPAVVA